MWVWLVYIIYQTKSNVIKGSELNNQKKFAALQKFLSKNHLQQKMSSSKFYYIHHKNQKSSKSS